MHRIRRGFFGGNHAAIQVPAAAAPPSTTTLNNADKAPGVTLSGGNLIATQSTADGSVRSIASHTSGKYYCEMTVGAGVSDWQHALGIANTSSVLTDAPGSPDANSGALYQNQPAIYIAGSDSGVASDVYVSGNVVGMAVDIDNKRIWYRVNGGNWNASGTNNPATNTGGASFSAITGAIYVLAYVGDTGSTNTMNFGATAYANAAPVGFGNW